MEKGIMNCSDMKASLELLVQAQAPSPHLAPISSSYNDRIRPVLDAVEKLRNLNVMKEGIQLPTIVVVGDQSSGKSSVLESLAGFSLPRGQGICTRVPLIMRLQHHPLPQPELSLHYKDTVVDTDEANIDNAINLATIAIAGDGKGISNTPLTLVVKKNGVPDLTMIDLPGITRVPVHGQPDNIYEQIAEIIMEYIKPEESIILNVLSATVDFPTCESIRMSQAVDRNGQRTLAVVTKVDKAPEGLLEKVTADDVKIGLGYVCVRNRIGDETYHQARKEESTLFQTHPLLSRLDKSIVGIPVLAQKLVHIQATIIARCLPEILKKINEKLNANMAEINRLPKYISSPSEAMATLMRFVGSTKESLEKLFVRGEYEDYYQHDKHMHSAARLVEMLNHYSQQLRAGDETQPTNDFLMDEISVLEEAKGIELPNFLHQAAFVGMMQKRLEGVSSIPAEFVAKVWSYIEEVLLSVLMHQSENYYQLQSCARRAGHNLVSKMKDSFSRRVVEMVEMEKMTSYTCNPEYMADWSKLMGLQELLTKYLDAGYCSVDLDGFGTVPIAHLKDHKQLLHQAFDLKMRMTAYWKIVLMRLVDFMALHLRYSIKRLVDKELEMEMVNEIMGPHGGGLERVMEESPSVAGKRDRLQRSVDLLKQSKDVLAEIMDRIATPCN